MNLWSGNFFGSALLNSLYYNTNHNNCWLKMRSILLVGRSVTGLQCVCRFRSRIERLMRLTCVSQTRPWQSPGWLNQFSFWKDLPDEENSTNLNAKLSHWSMGLLPRYCSRPWALGRFRHWGFDWNLFPAFAMTSQGVCWRQDYWVAQRSVGGAPTNRIVRSREINKPKNWSK